MTDVILRISGMDCGACAVRIVRALRGLPGVHAVFVSDTAGCARLTYDEAAVGLGEIARCVQRAGFDVPVETAELRCPGADDGAEALLAGKYAAQLVRGALHAPVRRLRHLRPRTATVVRDGVGTQVDADALTPRDVVRVLPGERVPVDGIVRSGTCTVDASALTGAARPAEKAVGDTVLAGTLNRAGSAFITPTAIGDATALQRTIAALQRAQTVRTPEQVRLERAASRLTALLVLLAIGVGAVWLFWRQPGDLARALTCTCAVLAATCPGAAERTARTVRRGIWLLLVYHAVCLPLTACGVIGPAAAAVLACGASGGVLLCALRGNETKRERP